MLCIYVCFHLIRFPTVNWWASLCDAFWDWGADRYAGNVEWHRGAKIAKTNIEIWPRGTPNSPTSRILYFIAKS